MARQGLHGEFLVPAPDLVAEPDNSTVGEDAPQTKKLDILQCLRDTLNDQTADWRSDHQAKAVTYAFQRERRFFCILNTAEGKSLVYQLPAKYDPPRCLTLVIVPNKVLLTDQLASCAKLKIPAMKWTADRPNSDAELSDDLRIIYVALETAGSQAFKEYVTSVTSHRTAGSAGKCFTHRAAASFETFMTKSITASSTAIGVQTGPRSQTLVLNLASIYI
jgi:hypothetical protein